MKFIPYILFISVFFLDYLSLDLGVLPRAATWLPELLSGLVCSLFIIHISAKKTLCLHPKYVLLFLVFVLTLLAGIVLNSVSPGAVFAGVRYYFKYIPFFLLPVIYEYSDDEIKKQLRFLLILGLIQLPIVLYQKFIQDYDIADLVMGTLVVSSVLSFYLISVISILFACYLKKKIGLRYFLLLTVLLFLPTALNETKSTVILLPASFAVIVYVSKAWHENKTKIIVALTTVSLLLVAFFGVYNVYFAESSTSGLVEFFTEPEDGIKRYFYSGRLDEVNPRALLNRKENVIGQNSALRPENNQDRSDIRRIDAIILPFHVLSTEPTKLILGLGMGNVSRSFIGGLSGEYTDIGAMNEIETAITVLIWELGLAGLILFLVFFFFIYRDAKKLSGKSILPGVFATGWAGVVCMFVLSLPYKNWMTINVMGYLIMYFSGYVAATCWRYQGWSENNSENPSIRARSHDFSG